MGIIFSERCFSFQLAVTSFYGARSSKCWEMNTDHLRMKVIVSILLGEKLDDTRCSLDPGINWLD